MELRPYQSAALGFVQARLWAGVNRQLLKLQTGMGKTVCFAALPDFMNFKNRMLVLVHREELAVQAADKLRRWNPNRKVGTEMANRRALSTDELVVASVQTIGRINSSRLRRFPPDEFDAVIIDEAHHAAARSYEGVLKHFRLFEDRQRLALGVTATPNRADRIALGNVFQEIVFDFSILDGIRQGWLADLKAFAVRTQTRLDSVRRRGDDFDVIALSRTVNTPARNDLVVRAWLDRARTRSTVAFAVDVQHAKDLAACFASYGVGAEAVWGGDIERNDKLQRHRNGTTRVIVNCQILTEGYDDWRIKCIVLARPTRSEGLYVQMVGRGTRIPEDVNNLLQARALAQWIQKEDCMLLDFVDVTTTHNLVSLPTLFGLNRGLNMEGLSLLNLMDKVEALRRAKTLLNLDSATEAVQLIGWAESVDLFGAEHGQTFLHILESIPLRKGFGSWHDQAPYPSQLMMCEWNHITVPLGATRGQVAAVLNEVIGRRQRAQRPDLYKETRDVSQ